MKSLEELKKMVKEATNCCGEEEAKFLSYNVKENKATLHPEYVDAKRFAEEGGQVLVLGTDKVYTYSIKNEEEYMNYLRNEIKQENYATMNRCGL
jgi:hypothetical protein